MFRFSTDPPVPKNISDVTDLILRYKSRILSHKLRVYFHKYRSEFRRQRKRKKGVNEDRSGYTVESLHACPRRQQIASTTRFVCRAPLIDDGQANLFFSRFSIFHHSPRGWRKKFLFCLQTTTHIRLFGWTYGTAVQSTIMLSESGVTRKTELYTNINKIDK